MPPEDNPLYEAFLLWRVAVHESIKANREVYEKNSACSDAWANYEKVEKENGR